MKYPLFDEIPVSREMTSAFMGLNLQTGAIEGEFEDMRNITVGRFPSLSPRYKRRIGEPIEGLQGVLDKESLIWIANNKLYIDGEEKELSEEIAPGKKQMYKMAAFILIMPDGIWYNVDKGECGRVDAEKKIENGTSVSLTLCNRDGNAITWHDEQYYKSNDPHNGDYMMTTTDARTSLKVFSEATNMWSAVPTTYFKIQSPGIGAAFEKDDGIKITIDNSAAKWDYAEKIFVNKEDDGRLSVYTWIIDKGDDYITITGILKENKTFTNMPMVLERKMPEMDYITECQNRLWGCSKDGHEIYCCKLGDLKNWRYYSGISTDSYAATVGSDGVFTGAVTYNGNPIFFKERYYLKVTVSATGAHSYREMPDRGVQKGSSKSIVLINGVLYYKGVSGVYAFDGSSPYFLSEKLGNHRYYDAVSGTIDGVYYMSCIDENGNNVLLTYDTTKQMWAAEDNLRAEDFCVHKDDLYILSGDRLYSVTGRGEGTLEKDFAWYAQSAPIGFALPDNKYVGRVNVRLSLEIGAYADFYIQYDSEGAWHHIFNMSGKGTRSFVIPVTPRRCDHFRWKISGKGDCKIYSVTKVLEEGSDSR